MSDPKNETTRREWLLRLGGAAFLCGFREAAGESLLGDAGEGPAAQKSLALPPGLYEPSNDHMTHALMSDERFPAIPPGCETDFVVPAAGPFQPRFFSPQELNVVHRLVALVLGEADAEAGSLDDAAAEIAEWIDLVASNADAVRTAARRLSPQHRALAISYHGPEVVQHLETAEPEKAWREGLNWLAAESQNHYGASFLELSQARQVELLTSLSDSRQDRSNENAGTHLFQLLKSQALQGFYTSQRGLKELDYKGNTFYAECPGCPGHNRT